MGIEFGRLQRLYGVNYYVLSPYELKSFKGVFNPGFLNSLKRIGSTLFYIGPPILLGVIIYECGNQINKTSQRKNPIIFECDV